MTKSHLHRRRAARRTGYDEGLAAGEAERNNLKGKYQSIVVLLNAARRRIQEIFDHLDDEGDRVYLGSTNHSDWLREMLNHMDRWSFDAMLPTGDINKMEADPYAEIRTQRARADAAEAEVKQLIAKCESSHGSSSAMLDVIAERLRQQDKEGWTPEHDDEHTDGSLALAAGSYCESAARPTILARKPSGAFAIPKLWPQSWSSDWWKPKSPREDLVRAAALIIAEIERLDRAAVPEKQEGGADGR